MMAPASSLVAGIKRNSLDDGPGIRTVVFFKGCPLACSFCQNPETQRPGRELRLDDEVCLGCGRCVRACPEGLVGSDRRGGPGEPGCRVCGACVEACPSEARSLVGDAYSVDELVRILALDEVFYRTSGGGVTFSGGEPTASVPFALEVARRLDARGIDLLVETCGHFRLEGAVAALLDLASTVYFDLKLIDVGEHRRVTGRSNRVILDNFRALLSSGRTAVLPRVPLIPGVTDSPENLVAIAELLVEVGAPEVALLEYNPLWRQKARAMGKPTRASDSHRQWMTSEQFEACRNVFRKRGVKVR